MSTPPKGRPPDGRTPEVTEAAQRFVTLIERTLAHVTAHRLDTARFSLSPATAMRVLNGVPTEQLRNTVIAVARIQAHLSEDGAGVGNAKAELEKLLAFWKVGSQDGDSPRSDR